MSYFVIGPGGMLSLMRMLPPFSTAMSVCICSRAASVSRLPSAVSRPRTAGSTPSSRFSRRAERLVAAELRRQRRHPLLHARVDLRVLRRSCVSSATRSGVVCIGPSASTVMS